MTRQPQLYPRPAPDDVLLARSTSSQVSWPTSPIQSVPVTRSNENRHGLRRP